MNDQLLQLATPFPKELVKKPAPGKFGEYVAHSTVTERLISIVGIPDFQLVEIVRGYAPEFTTKTDPPRTYTGRDNAVVGVVARLTVTVDGVNSLVEEAGSEDHPAMSHDGDNLKNCMSDAYKRCAMRLGLGLHLWSGADYFLNKQLAKDQEATPAEAGADSDDT